MCVRVCVCGRVCVCRNVTARNRKSLYVWPKQHPHTQTPHITSTNMENCVLSLLKNYNTRSHPYVQILLHTNAHAAPTHTHTNKRKTIHVPRSSRLTRGFFFASARSNDLVRVYNYGVCLYVCVYVYMCALLCTGWSAFIRMCVRLCERACNKMYSGDVCCRNG